MIEKMDKMSEQRVFDAVGSSIRLANEGMSPDEAVAKAASDAGFGKEHARRIVEAFNVSKTLNHHKSSELEEKAADFPIADVDKVYSLMYPEDIATPAEKHAELAHSEGTPAESRFFMTPETEMIKLSTGPEVSSGSVDVNNLIKRAHGELEVLQRTADDARYDETCQQENLRGVVAKIAAYFHTTPHESFERVEKVALAAVGDEMKPLLDAVWEAGYLGSCGEKRASGPEQLTDVDLHVFELFDKAASVRNDIQKARELAKVASDARDAYASRLREQELGIANKSAFLHPASIAGGALADTAISKAMRAPDISETLLAVNKMVSDPAYEAERKSIGARRMLHRFMGSDEVLSKASPRAVIEAYNELATIAPSSMESEGTARALLRRRVEQGQIDPFEVSNIVGLERHRKQTLEPSQELSQLLNASSGGGARGLEKSRA